MLFFLLLFIYWLCWVFVSVRGPSPAAASGGHSSSWCAGLSPSRPLLLRSTGSRTAGSVIVAHGPSCSAARGILPDQGSNQRPLHRQADSQPLRHQGSPCLIFYTFYSVSLGSPDLLPLSTQEVIRQFSLWRNWMDAVVWALFLTDVNFPSLIHHKMTCTWHDNVQNEGGIQELFFFFLNDYIEHWIIAIDRGPRICKKNTCDSKAIQTHSFS